MSLFEEDELQKLVVEATPDREGAKTPRFVTAEQVALISGLLLPSLIVPIATASGPQGEWETVTIDGTVIAPPSKETFDEMMRQIGVFNLRWGWAPKARMSTMLVSALNELTRDATPDLAGFERWLVEHRFPFDRIDAPAISVT